jgi:hypothetical protein
MNGIVRRPLVFAIPVLIAVMGCFDLTIRVSGLNATGFFGDEMRAGFSDYLAYLYGGMDKYVPGPSMPFLFPSRWAMIFLSAAFATLTYAYKDMQSYGQQILVRMRGRISWWLSKCVWNAAKTLLYHSLCFLACVMFCIFAGVSLSGGMDKDILYAVFNTSRENIPQAAGAWPTSMLLLPVLISVGLNLAQMTLSLFVRPVFSFLALAFLMIISAYFTSPYLIGNYAMPMRYDAVILGGVNIHAGWIIGCAFIVVPVLAGALRFRRYDILNME